MKKLAMQMLCALIVLLTVVTVVPSSASAQGLPIYGYADPVCQAYVANFANPGEACDFPPVKTFTVEGIPECMPCSGK